MKKKLIMLCTMVIMMMVMAIPAFAATPTYKLVTSDLSHSYGYTNGTWSGVMVHLVDSRYYNAIVTEDGSKDNTWLKYCGVSTWKAFKKASSNTMIKKIAPTDTVKWTSSDTSIVKLGPLVCGDFVSDGMSSASIKKLQQCNKALILGKPGTATITATVNGKSCSWKVTVKAPTASVNKTTLSLAKKEYAKLTYSARATDQANITVTSSNKNVVAVSKTVTGLDSIVTPKLYKASKMFDHFSAMDGQTTYKLVAKGKGTATVTIKGKYFTKSFKITVK